jgi:hypothetical protein
MRPRNGSGAIQIEVDGVVHAGTWTVSGGRQPVLTVRGRGFCQADVLHLRQCEVEELAEEMIRFVFLRDRPTLAARLAKERG